jgi:biopolymer transport protein ExbB/TolQ
MQPPFNVSWKTVAIIAIAAIALLMISREIHSWLVYRDAKTMINQVQHNIAEQDKAIRDSQQQMVERGKQFEKAVDSHIQSTDERIEATEKVFKDAWQELDKKSKEQPPTRSMEDFQRDVDRMMQQRMKETPLQSETNQPNTAQQK